MGSEKKIRTGYMLSVLLLAMTLLLSLFLVFAHNENLPMLKSTGAGLLGFGEEETFTARGGAVKSARPDYFSNIYEFSDGDTFMVVGWIARLIYWVFCALGICVLVNACIAYFSNPEKLGRALTFLLGEICFGFAIVAIALISIGYPSLLFRNYTYSTQYYFLLIPLVGALIAAGLTKKEFKATTVAQTSYRAYPASQSGPASGFCTKCGKLIPQGARFCVYCGGEVLAGNMHLPENAYISKNSQTTASQPNPGSNVKQPTQGITTFYMAIEDVFSITGRGTIATGRIQGGALKNGDTAYIVKSNGQTIATQIMSIEAFGKKDEKAEVGENVGLLLRGVTPNDVTKGDVISASEKLSPPAAASARQLAAVHENKTPLSILDKYRLGRSYLDECGAFDESKFREFNRIAGNQFSDADIAKQLENARMMLRGMDDLKQTLRATMIEAIQTFEELERRGIDLSKYNI